MSDPIAARIRPNVASFLISLPQRGFSAPAAFDPVVTPAMVRPATGHPHSVVPPGDLISARHPDVCTSVPAVIAGDPYISTPGRRTVVFHNRVRRPDANVNLPVGSSRKQRAGQQGCKRKLLHDDDILRDSKAASGIFWKFQYLCELNAEIED